MVLCSDLDVNTTIDLSTVEYAFVDDNDGSESIMNISSGVDLDGESNVKVLTTMPYDGLIDINAGRIAIFFACENQSVSKSNNGDGCKKNRYTDTTDDLKCLLNDIPCSQSTVGCTPRGVDFGLSQWRLPTL